MIAGEANLKTLSGCRASIEYGFFGNGIVMMLNIGPLGGRRATTGGNPIT